MNKIGNHIFIFLLSLNHPDEIHADKKGIISGTGAGWPLGDSNINPFFRASPFGVSEVLRVCQPAGCIQLFVNKLAGFSLGKLHLVGKSFGCLSPGTLGLFWNFLSLDAGKGGLKCRKTGFELG